MKNIYLIVGFLLFLLFAFFKISKTNRKEEQPDFSNVMSRSAEEAVSIAREKYQTELDLSPESIQSIEQILDILHEEYQESEFSKDRMALEVIHWGAYTGEVIKKIHATHWEKDSKIAGKNSYPLVFENEKRETFPVSWVHKRIVNGIEDNIWHKFQVFILADQESFDKFSIGDEPDTETK